MYARRGVRLVLHDRAGVLILLISTFYREVTHATI